MSWSKWWDSNEIIDNVGECKVPLWRWVLKGVPWQKWEGPFEIEEVLGPVTYQLKLPETWRIHNVFHAILLQPYTETEAHGNNYPWPLPDLLEGEEVYTIEQILKHWWRGRDYQYYVLWEGCPITEALWESELAFSADGDMLALYKEQHQLPWNTLSTEMNDLDFI